jgi:hypothetical protein
LAPVPGAAETVTFQQVAKLTASDAAVWDNFGYSLKIDGDRLIVGALWDDDLGPQSGSAYLFERDAGGSEWREVAKLLAPDGGANEWFGYWVAISGETAVVGAVLEVAMRNERPAYAWVFERDEDGSWVAVAKLQPESGELDDAFGAPVAISGDTAAVGAGFADGPGGSFDGAVYVFERDAGGPGAWGQTAKLTPAKACDISPPERDGTACGWVSDDLFGAGLALGEDVVAAGSEGYVYLFRRVGKGPGAEWQLLTRFVPADYDRGVNSGFGTDLAISGGTLLAGADGDQDIDARAGAAYVLESDPGGPAGVRQTDKFYAPDGDGGDWFGYAVGLSGETAVVGAPELTEGGRGFGYIFRRDGGSTRSWSAVTKLLPAELEGGDRFGEAVAISGDTAVVGAWGDDDRGTEAGAVYVFQEVAADPR